VQRACGHGSRASLVLGTGELQRLILRRAGRHDRLSQLPNTDVAGGVGHVVYLLGSSQMREEESQHGISNIGVGPTGSTSAHHVDVPATNDICEEVSLHSTVVQSHSRAIDVAEAKTECIDTE